MNTKYFSWRVFYYLYVGFGEWKSLPCCTYLWTFLQNRKNTFLLSNDSHAKLWTCFRSRTQRTSGHVLCIPWRPSAREIAFHHSYLTPSLLTVLVILSVFYPEFEKGNDNECSFLFFILHDPFRWKIFEINWYWYYITHIGKHFFPITGVSSTFFPKYFPCNQFQIN